MRPPAYDSGWVNTSHGRTYWFNHNLNTTELLVYLISDTEDDGINQVAYGGKSPWVDGIFWYNLTSSRIGVYVEEDDVPYLFVRVMMWKIVKS